MKTILFTPDKVCEELAVIIQLMSELPENMPNSNWGKEHLLLDLPYKWKLSFGVYIGDVLRGLIFASNKLGKYHIHYITVDKGMRGGGAGKAMIREAGKLAMLYGLSGITLKVFKLNQPAIEFYRRQGFQEKSASDDYLLFEKLSERIS